MPQTFVIEPLQSVDAPAVYGLAGRLRRWFSPADLQAIAALLAAEHPAGWVARALPGAETNGLQSSTRPHVAPARVGAGALVGFLLTAPTADPLVREIAWMGVDEPWQRHGIGTVLLKRAIADARAAGLHEIEVSTVAASSGYAPYEATRAFYHARGFVDRRVDRDYYWPGGDRLVLRRRL